MMWGQVRRGELPMPEDDDEARGDPETRRPAGRGAAGLAASRARPAPGTHQAYSGSMSRGRGSVMRAAA